jgi:hypothetical protein
VKKSLRDCSIVLPGRRLVLGLVFDWGDDNPLYFLKRINMNHDI